MFKNILFDFSSVKSGGGLKRLTAFANWFESRGGACFILSDELGSFEYSFVNNVFFFVKVGRFERAISSDKYLVNVIRQLPDNSVDFIYCYNSTGLKKPQVFGVKQWYHLSNVLPLLNPLVFGTSFFRSLQLILLGFHIKSSLPNFSYVSAESFYSLSLIPDFVRKVVSYNGSDDELDFISIHNPCSPEYAICVGTHGHKDLLGCYHFYLSLKEKSPGLLLYIVGDDSNIPSVITTDLNVSLLGNLSHDETLKLISNSKCYISLTLVENSWNAAAEGLVLSPVSYISDILPHREVLASSKYSTFEFCSRTIIKSYNQDFNISSLHTWDDVISNFLSNISKV